MIRKEVKKLERETARNSTQKELSKEDKGMQIGKKECKSINSKDISEIYKIQEHYA